MQCVPISDETYRQAAQMAHISDVDLAPVSDPQFVDMRAQVDAILQRALRIGMRVLLHEQVTS